MATIRSVVEEFLQDQDWNYDELKNANVLRFNLTTPQANYTCFAQMDEDQEQFMLYTCLPNKVEAEARRNAAEYLTRANYGMRIGNFEMDLEDGEVRFKCSVDVEGSELVKTMIGNMFAMSVRCCDTYYAGLMSVLFGGVDPARAVAKAETLSSIPDEI